MKPAGTIENAVLFGREGTLFLAGGSHSVLEIVTGARPVPEACLRIFLDNISARARWAAQRPVPYRHLVFPDKQSVVPDRWPFDTCIRLGGVFRDAARPLSLPVLYPADLLAARAEDTVSRVDTHVTAHGSIVVAAALVEDLTGTDQSALRDRLLGGLTATERRSGDLGGKLQPPILDQEKLFSSPAPGRILTNGMRGGNNGGVDLRFNPDPPFARRLVMFGDSFGRDLCRFLQHWFREVVFLRTGFFHPELADQLRPDLLVTENVERYLDNCLDDAERPDFLLYPLLGHHALEPSDGFAEAFSALLAGDRPPYARFARAEYGHVPKRAANDPQPASGWDVGAPIPLRPEPPRDDVRRELEPVRLVERRPPVLIVNQSGLALPDLFQPLQDIHGSDLVRRTNVLLFGPNLQVTIDGAWACESRSFPMQFLDLAMSQQYAATLPGPKPRLVRDPDDVDRMSLVFDPEAAGQLRAITTPVFLATPLEPTNWGRWVATVIPKIAQYRLYGKGRRFFCCAALPWQRALLKRLGITEAELLPHDPGGSYVCDDVLTVDYSVTNMTVSALERARFDDLRAQVFLPEGLHPSRIYISRLGHSRRHPDYRVLANEAELIAGLDAIGFVAIEPETMTFDQQVQHFAAADIVVCLGGAAIYNAVFCRPGTVFVTIESSFMFLGPHCNLLASLPLRFGVVIGRQDPSDPAPVHKRWTIDVGNAVDRIEAALAEIDPPDRGIARLARNPAPEAIHP